MQEDVISIAAKVLFCSVQRAGMLDLGTNDPGIGQWKASRWWNDCAVPLLVSHRLMEECSGIFVPTSLAAGLREDLVWMEWGEVRARVPDRLAACLDGFERDCRCLGDIVRGLEEPAHPASLKDDIPAITKHYLECWGGEGEFRVALVGPRSSLPGTYLGELASLATIERFSPEELGDNWTEERNGAGNGGPMPFDLIIADRILSGSTDRRSLIQRLKAGLYANGLLVIADYMEDLSLGISILAGLRPWLETAQFGYPDADVVETLLESEGFRYFFADDESNDLGMQVIVAESDGVVFVGSAGTPETQYQGNNAHKLVVSEENGDSRGSNGSPVDHVEQLILAALSDALRLDPLELSVDRAFSEYGLDSLLGVRFVNHVNSQLMISLNAAIVFEHSSIRALAQHIVSSYPGEVAGWKKAHGSHGGREEGLAFEGASTVPPAFHQTPSSRPSRAERENDIAVIGMSGQFPMAEDYTALWNNLSQGLDAIGELRGDYFDPRHLAAVGESGAGVSHWGGVLRHRDFFDPLFFNLSPADAEGMSPHQRLVLQEGWRAFEDAGCVPKELEGQRVGVFVGAEPTGYSSRSFAGSSEAIVGARISYFLNLRGPAMVVNTGCSSSAMAIHLACESIRSGESEICLAGGVSAALRTSVLLELSRLGILSRTGRCRAFDAAADGTVISEAVGFVVLKRLSDAIRDGDLVHGIICASGANQDGGSNGITAPNGAAQEELIVQTHDRFGIDARSISYVEAHGTGTALGDPVEVNALARAFGKPAEGAGSCLLGSIKASIGHAAAASGVVGLIKVLLCLRQGKLPTQLNCDEVNPLLELGGSALEVMGGACEWHPSDPEARIAALNSFGHSGTNVHLVVRGHKQEQVAPVVRPYFGTASLLVPVSARSRRSLKANVQGLLAMIDRADADKRPISLEDLAFSLQTTREHMSFRVVILARSIEQLRERLEAAVDSGVDEAASPSTEIWWGRLGASKGQVVHVDPFVGKLEDIAAAWVRGAAIDWGGFWAQRGGSPRRIRLPTYSFEQLRFPVQWPDEISAKEAPPGPVDRYVQGDPAQEESPAHESELLAMVPSWVSHPTTNKLEQCEGLGNILVIGAERLPAEVASRFDVRNLVDRGAGLHRRVRDRLDADASIGRILWIAPHSTADINAMSQAQDSGVVEIFRLATSLGASNHIGRPLDWAFVTKEAIQVSRGDAIDPTHSGVHGIAGVLSKEFSRWKARCVDVDNLDCVTASWFWNDNWMPVAGNAAVRDSVLRTQVLLRAQLPSPVAPSLRKSGVYIVVGGAGGLGEIWSKFAIQNYDAQLIWLGRRALDDDISLKIENLGALGRAPIYVQGDARDAPGLRALVQAMKVRFSFVDGIIHAAVGAFDLAMKAGDEENFRDVLSTKVDIAVNIGNAALLEQVETIVFFSSLASLYKTAGMAGYVSGCAFKDSLANWLAASIPSAVVKTVNWGYWGAGTGLTVSGESRIRWKNSGFEEIGPLEGMKLLEAFVSSPLSQLAAVRTRRPGMVEGLDHDSGVECLPSDETGPIVGLENLLHPDPDTLSAIDPSDEALEQLLLGLLEVQLAKIGCTSAGSAAALDWPYAQWCEQSLKLIRAGKQSSNAEQPADIWTKWGLRVEADSGCNGKRANIALLDACVRAIPDVLTKKKRATDVLFPSGSMTLVEDVYKTNAVASFFNEQLVRVLRTLISNQVRNDPQKKIRILEIGAGTGGTTEKVLPLLDEYSDHIAHYCYTDISRYFLTHAMDHYMPGRPWLVTELLDIERGVEAQGFDVGSYDYVIATNALHATRCIRDTLANSKSLLRAGGAILLNEVSKPALFTHLTFGLLDGWWVAEDQDERIEGAPGLTPGQWRYQLELEGFCSVSVPVQGADDLGNQLIVAFSNGVIRRVWDNATEAPLLRNGGNSVPRAKQLQTDVANGDGEEASLQGRKRGIVLEVFASVLKMPAEDIDPAEPLDRYGIDSLVMVEITKQLEHHFGPIDSAVLFDVASIDAVMGQLGDVTGSAAPADPQEREDGGVHRSYASVPAELSLPDHSSSAYEPIAVVGMAGRYPMASDLRQFWENLATGRECIGEFGNDRWELDDFYESDPDEAINSGKSYSRRCGVLEGFADFDAEFFGIAESHALNMDPQERLLVQSCWHVLEDAGYTKKRLREKYECNVGVFVGITRNGYTLHGRDIWKAGEPYPFSSFSSAANRVSYLLDLRGPSMPIDTMCSSSLTAIHEACSHIHSGDCELAIAGGVNIYLHPSNYIGLCADRMLSPGGHTRSFGIGADGFVPGEGVGTVLLKRLSDAIADGDNIHAIIKGSQVNHGGKSMNYATPSPAAQRALIRRTLSKAGVTADEVTYIEAHGTGTDFGDAIEVSALSKVFSPGDGRSGWCVIGSCKPNIGHLESAAGIASLSKVILQLQHRKIAPGLHVAQPSPRLRIEGSPFVLQSNLVDWPSVESAKGDGLSKPRIAGVSAFGAGGSNAHVIVEEYIAELGTETGAGSGDDEFILPVSAPNAERLKARVSELIDWLEGCQSGTSPRQRRNTMRNIAYTLQTGREAMATRVAVVASSIADAVVQLRARFCTIGDDQRQSTNLGQGSVSERRGLETGDIENQDPVSIARYWELGGAIEWETLYGGTLPLRISLPLYPFAATRYWTPNKAGPYVQSPPASEVALGVESKQGQVNVDAKRHDAFGRYLSRWVSSETEYQESEIDQSSTFFDMGVSSAGLVRLLQGLELEFGLELDPSVPFDYCTIRELSRYLSTGHSSDN